MFKLSLKSLLSFLAVIGLLIFLHFTSILTPVETAITKIMNPVLARFHFAGSYVRNTYGDQKEKQELIDEIAKYKEQINKLVVENVRFRLLEDENQTLREHLTFHTNSELPYALANIVSRDGIGSDKSSQNIIIDKGGSSGIKIGAPVLSGKGVIVGKIVSVKDSIAQACLVTDQNCKLAVTTQNTAKTIGVIEGEMGLTIKMDFIPQTEQIEGGNTVITSGLEQNIPRGLVVGKIASVNRENNELWQSAVIEPIVDLDKLTIVSVLLPE